MVGKQQTTRPAVASPPYNVESPDRPHPDSFMLQTMMEMTRSQGTLTEAVRGLQAAIDRLSIKMEKIDDLRVAVGKVESATQTLTSEMDSTKTKLDSVRTWVLRATGVIMFVAVCIPLAVHYLPSFSSNGSFTSSVDSKVLRR